MRRMHSILIVLTLALCATALAGCSSGFSQCPTICQPSGTYEHVVCERCIPIDRNGNPLYARGPCEPPPPLP